MKNGYYTDEGELIDVESMAMPSLCKNCKKKDRPEEKIPCNLNRFDQQKETKVGKKFICDAFDPEYHPKRDK